jgi:hypothetical protein
METTGPPFLPEPDPRLKPSRVILAILAMSIFIGCIGAIGSAVFTDRASPVADGFYIGLAVLAVEEGLVGLLIAIALLEWTWQRIRGRHARKRTLSELWARATRRSTSSRTKPPA